MTSTTPHAPEHPPRRSAAQADPANPALRTVPAPINTALIPTCPRDAVIDRSAMDPWNQLHEQESFVMRISPFIAAAAMPNRSARSGLANHHLPESTACVGDCEPAPWPFNPDDVSPLQWWRTMPADHLDAAQHLLLRAAMAKICLLKEREWIASLHDDAAASIAVALGALPIIEITLEVDLAMSALTVTALGGNAGSVLVLSHILQRAPLDHPFARELSVSWQALNRRRALEARMAAKAKVKANAIARRHETANRHTVDHRAAFNAGDVL